MARAQDSKSHRVGSVVFGGALMLVGLLFLMERLSISEEGSTWRFWPVVLLGLGISKIWQGWGLPEAASGAWLAFTGLWFLVVNFRLFGLTYGNSWPLFVIAGGGAMIVKALLPPRPADDAPEEAAQDPAQNRPEVSHGK